MSWGWIILVVLVVALIINHVRRMVRCRLCKQLFKPSIDLIDPWDKGWAHCPWCREYGKPPGSIGADGRRLK